MLIRFHKEILSFLKKNKLVFYIRVLNYYLGGSIRGKGLCIMIIHASISWLFPFYFPYISHLPITKDDQATCIHVYLIFLRGRLINLPRGGTHPRNIHPCTWMHFLGCPYGIYCDWRAKESHKLSYCHIKLRRLSFKLGEMTWSQWAKDFFLWVMELPCDAP